MMAKHDEYGPIYQLTLFGTTHVRINSEQIAQEILAKRGAIYSNRAPTPNIPGAKVDAEYLPLLDNNGTLHAPFYAVMELDACTSTS
jgi:hypothetical protein